MRSTNVSPGFDVMRTTMRSESTRVPPVTALRSPPDSRTTGADSPVMADSSTVAMPRTMSPSPGISSPADDHHDVAEREFGRRDVDQSRRVRLRHPSARRRRSTRCAIVLVRVLRRLAACALPRPSATDSARLAKRTVSQSQTAMPHVNPAGDRRTAGLARRRPGTARRSRWTVVRAAPTQTRNMTGLRHRAAGLSLRSAPGSAWTSCAQLNARERGGFGATVPATGPSTGSGVEDGVETMVDMFRRALPPGDPA